MYKKIIVFLSISFFSASYACNTCDACDSCDNYREQRSGMFYRGLRNQCDHEPIKIRQKLSLYDVETSRGLYR